MNTQQNVEDSSGVRQRIAIMKTVKFTYENDIKRWGLSIYIEEM